MDDRLVPRSVSASHQNGTNEAAAKANDQDPTTKWCATSSQSQTPYLQYVLKDTAVIERWMVLGAARESGGYVAKSFKLQYQADDGTWVDADVVEGNQMNKVIRTLPQPITASRVRLQMIQGEQDGYTTRIYEFAVYGYVKADDPTGIGNVLSDEGQESSDMGQGSSDKGQGTDNGWYDLQGHQVHSAETNFQRGIYIRKGKKYIKP